MDSGTLQRIEQLFVKQGEDFQRQMGILAENFDHKLDLVIDGHQMLSCKIDRLDTRMAWNRRWMVWKRGCAYLKQGLHGSSRK
jgi:hypothetical protein